MGEIKGQFSALVSCGYTWLGMFLHFVIKPNFVEQYRKGPIIEIHRLFLGIYEELSMLVSTYIGTYV